MDPPPCVQNAMMTKDKKPFTYTPGGIDLSEARSPRLQRRIERNANLGGAGDASHQPPHPHITGPLPPSALAAMRPQPQVQVFPSGPAPPAPIRGGIPPPPPAPKHGVPPPPPPPSGPLPTQKVCTADNLVLDRPDMTKIIPENPMALLRKTSGPQPRKTLVDQIFEDAAKGVPEPKSPPYQTQQTIQPQSPPQRIQPVTLERGAPISPVPQKTYKPPQQYQPPPQQPLYQPPVQQNRQQYSQPAQPAYPEPVKEQPRYQPPVIERPSVVPPKQYQPDVKTSTAHLGSLYIPAVNQQNQKKIVSPPTPPERNLESPSIQTPPLREAPKPWQMKKPQEEVPAWAKKENQIANNVEVVRKASPPLAQQQQIRPQVKQNNQQTYVESQPNYNQPQSQYQQQTQYRPDQNQHQQPIGVRIEIRTRPQSQYQNESEETKPNAVYITQPLVLQHPGGNVPQRQPQGSGNQGPRVIPVQIEGANQAVGNERVLNRQQSWGNNPSQSNSFKVIQKITNTDAEDNYGSIPITEHSPKFPQNFQQVSRGPQSAPQKGPLVRTIPIQIEGDDAPKQYVHPSEQVVPEPKKYTGSSIPSRSFKILQAMTAPDNCANVDDRNEEFTNDEWFYPPYYPPYPYSPYWYEYYHHYYPESYPEELFNKKTTPPPPRNVSRSTSPASCGRHTPLPFWGYPPQYYPPPNVNDSGRDTPKPVFPPWANVYAEQNSSDSDHTDNLPYYDPYFYHYYYGYPPMPSRYPYYPSDTEGYSSMDEKYKSNKNILEPQPKRVTRQTTTKERLTPTLNIREVVIQPKEEKIESSECETDTETDDEYCNHLEVNPLKSMKSITNINVYSSDDDVSNNDGVVEEYSDESNEDMDDASSMGYEEDQYPHQLSVIMEESERAESRLRTISALSDSTTLAEKSEEEDEYFNQIEKLLSADIKDETQTRIIKECEHNDKPLDIIENTEVNEVEDDDKKSNESEDWWGIIGNEDDDLPRRKQPLIEVYISNSDNNLTITEDEESQNKDEVVEKYYELGNENANVSNESNVPKNRTQIFEDLEKRKEPINDAYSSNSDNNSTIIEDRKSENIENEVLAEEHNENKSSVHNNKIQLSDANNPEEPIEYSVVLRRKKIINSEKNNTKPRPRSIYDSLEDIKTESTGSLIKVDNFVDILEKIQNDFGSFLNSRSETKNDTLCKSNRPVSMYEMTEPIETKPLEAKEKRFSYSSFEDYNRSSDDDKANKDYDNSVNGSASYNKYNLSKSESPVLMNKVENNNGVKSLNSLETEESSEEIDTSCSDKVEKECSEKSPAFMEKVEHNYDSKCLNISETEESSEETDTSCSEKDEKDSPDKNYVQLTDESDIKVPSIKDRIQALRENINYRRNKYLDPDEKNLTKDKISVSKPTSSKSSFKSFEESEEEEVDSGVTSDMSRHISDTEEFPELKKMTKYQRAATHSRLYKLLQEECNEGNDEIKDEQSVQKPNLNLSLNQNTAVNDRLVNELIDSLLKLKKGQVFKNLPKEKLYAAAVKILQEDIEIMNTPPEDLSSFLSPRLSTGYSTAVQTPQEFNNTLDEYKLYYESWNRSDESFDIFPSKAFKGLQSGALGSLGKCPRVLSAKNIHKKLIKLLETSENSSPIPDKPPLETNEVTSVS